MQAEAHPYPPPKSRPTKPAKTGGVHRVSYFNRENRKHYGRPRLFGPNAAWTRRGPRKSSRTPAARSVPHSRLLPNNPASAGTNPPACKRKRTYTPTQVKAYKTRENRGRPSSFLFQPLRNQLDLEQLRPPLAGHKQPIALRVVRDSVQHVDPDPLRQRQYPAQINPRHHLARH